MRTKNQIKGDSLEDAVHTIESHIFKTNPALKESTIEFERKKIIYLMGAKSEIDLYAKINMGNEYEAVFIFECKNWDRKIGKNEVIVFSEKIREIKAQKGFFIAKEFSMDAIKRAKADGRITLLKVSNEVTLYEFPIHSFAHRFTESAFTIMGSTERSYSPENTVQIGGKEMGLFEFGNTLLSEMDADIAKNEPELHLKAHTFERIKNFNFGEGQLIIDGEPVRGIKATATIVVEELVPVVISQFNVEKKGRYCTIQFLEPFSKSMLEVDFSQLI